MKGFVSTMVEPLLLHPSGALDSVAANQEQRGLQLQPSRPEGASPIYVADPGHGPHHSYRLFKCMALIILAFFIFTGGVSAVPSCTTHGSAEMVEYANSDDLPQYVVANDVDPDGIVCPGSVFTTVAGWAYQHLGTTRFVCTHPVGTGICGETADGNQWNFGGNVSYQWELQRPSILYHL